MAIQCRSSSEVDTRTTPERTPWSAPRLLRMGTVAALTSKKDLAGKNDGGTGLKRRT